MPVTITINGLKTKVESSAVEGAFRTAIAEAPAERGVKVSLSSSAVSKIASDLGFGETQYTGVGNATRRVFPGALIARAAEILGGAELVAATWSDPETEAREAEAAAIDGAATEARVAAFRALAFKIEVRAPKHSVEGNAWVARVTARDGAGRFEREFLPLAEDGGNRDHAAWIGADGIFQINTWLAGSRENHRYFLVVNGGVGREVSPEEAEAAIPLVEEVTYPGRAPVGVLPVLRRSDAAIAGGVEAIRMFSEGAELQTGPTPNPGARPMAGTWIAIKIDEENESEAWWEAIEDRYPRLANSIRRNRCAVIRAEFWDTLAALPGFGDGLEMAPNPIIDCGGEGEQWADVASRPHSVFEELD